MSIVHFIQPAIEKDENGKPIRYLKGDRGARGPIGENGRDGAPGKDSQVPGPKGADGKPGRDGVSIQGQKGSPGKNGRDGNVWLVGKNNPVEPANIVGDLYFNTTTCDVYRWDSKWEKISNLRGSEGRAGKDSTVPGPQGISGRDGADAVIPKQIPLEEGIDKTITFKGGATLRFENGILVDFKLA